MSKLAVLIMVFIGTSSVYASNQVLNSIGDMSKTPVNSQNSGEMVASNE